MHHHATSTQHFVCPNYCEDDIKWLLAFPSTTPIVDPCFIDPSVPPPCYPEPMAKKASVIAMAMMVTLVAMMIVLTMAIKVVVTVMLVVVIEL